MGGGGPRLAMHINALAARGGGMRFERISAARREQIHRAVREQHLANERRGQLEARGAREGGKGPMKMDVPKSSLAANHTQGAGTQHPTTNGRLQTPQKGNTRQPTRFGTRQPVRKPGEKER